MSAQVSAPFAGKNPFKADNPNYPKVYWSSDPIALAQYWSRNFIYCVRLHVLEPARHAVQHEFLARGQLGHPRRVTVLRVCTRIWASRFSDCSFKAKHCNFSIRGALSTVVSRNWTVEVPPHGITV
jgi:hypothetical protein